MKNFDFGLWWVTSVSVRKLVSGRWRVEAWSAKQKNSISAPIREVVYAPSSCETERNRIYSIKLFRKKHGCGLSQARDYVDMFAVENQWKEKQPE